jgi:hypothetical protein
MEDLFEMRCQAIGRDFDQGVALGHGRGAGLEIGDLLIDE